MKPKQAQRLRDFLFALGFFVTLSASLFGSTMLWIGSVIMFSGLIPHFLYNKCPHCGRQLRAWSQKAPHCPFCGRRVDEE